MFHSTNLVTSAMSHFFFKLSKLKIKVSKLAKADVFVHRVHLRNSQRNAPDPKACQLVLVKISNPYGTSYFNG